MTGHFTSYENRTDHELATRVIFVLTRMRLCQRRAQWENGPLQKEATMTLKDKRVVVLGGTSGIGLAVAEAAAAEGAQVLVASSDDARVKRALTTLPTCLLYTS